MYKFIILDCVNIVYKTVYKLFINKVINFFIFLNTTYSCFIRLFIRIKNCYFLSVNLNFYTLSTHTIKTTKELNKLGVVN